MRKAPFIILTLVVVFLSVVVGVLVHRARIPRKLPTEPAATNADYRLKQVHLQEQGRDGSRWQLDAEYAETFEEQNKTTMRKVTIKVDQPPKGDQASRSWTVTGDEGDLNQDTKDVELRGNVVLVSSNGLRLETDRLRWDAEGQRAWTEDPVVIYRAGAPWAHAGPARARAVQTASAPSARRRITSARPERDRRARRPRA